MARGQNVSQKVKRSQRSIGKDVPKVKRFIGSEKSRMSKRPKVHKGTTDLKGTKGTKGTKVKKVKMVQKVKKV